MTFNDLNVNYGIKYDHRNLLIELYHKNPWSVSRPNTYASRYFYDESGNRVRKLIYFNSQSNPPPVTDWINPGNGWALSNNEFYAKGVDGKDLATYQGNNLDEWFVWGNDMVGKIKNNIAYYYYKDHLGSVRAVVKDNGTIVAGYDYDAWGYPLENRTFNSDSIKFKYTGKETDKESFYDYFGARYYDGRVGRWGQVEPLMEKYLSWSPYNYSICNPTIFIDVDGLDIDISHFKTYETDLISNLELVTGLDLDVKDNKIVDITTDRTNLAGSENARALLLEAINSENTFNIIESKNISQAKVNNIELSPKQIKGFMDKENVNNVDPNTMGWAMTLFHELYHTHLKNINGDPINFGEINIIDKDMNKIRRQLTKSTGNNYGKRMSHKARGFTGEPFAYLPMDKASRKALLRGSPPPDQSKYIKIY